ncbi:peptidylprolyl isomerase [Sphingobium nicotianae]|uniref:Parvulin-like PPIase n=1 Tax=Sphingobium nicotianae TaxID=2782607 RepID=A0A9X1DCS2_9SPHN|nr:peptidylprolyl isomerase [Sphingobium nicotianae]MBT2187628.1 peptidyl-prolyl cis-trans isomerase [Sphingobium nicotianae]
MNFFRRIIGSKWGGTIAVLFLGMIALAFVIGDMKGSGGIGVLGAPSEGEVAKVGGRALTVNELQARAQLVFERMREDQPTLTIDQFISQGGLRRVADELIGIQALIAYGDKHGMRISKKLIDAQIASNPAFVDATGNFSETVFRQLLAQRRVSEKDMRTDITGQILQQQMLGAVSAGARTPDGMVPPYAAMLIEERDGGMYAIPSAAFAPKTPPSDAELQAYYRANGGQFAVPEQRRLRYATINLARFEAAATPTDAELVQAYKAKAAQYQARQSRDMSQLILTSEAAAKDAAAKAKAGTPLADVAKTLGLSATRIDGVDQTQLAAQTNADIAKAAFAAGKGGIIGPIRAPLGWAVLRVEEVRDIPGKTLEQAKAELIPEARTAKQKQLFSEFLNKLDGKLGEGANFAELAKANGLEIVETPFIIKDGKALKDPDFKADPTLTALLKQGFAMSSDDDPQIVPVKPDEEAAVLAVGEVVPAGPPPYAEVKAAVQIAWGLSKGAGQAREVATKLAAELGRGGDPAAILAKLGIPATVPQQKLHARRADINNQENGKIPPPLQALFTINVGATKVLPLDNSQGFLVVRLDKITPNDPTKIPQLMQSTKAGLSNVLGGEYARQFLVAIENDLGVERNQAAFATVEAALRQANGAAAAQ